MKSIKFIHCADIHLDVPFSSLGNSGESSFVRRQDIKMTFQKIIDIAYNEQVDFIFITGDLYEHNYVTKSTINFANECFKKIDKTKVIMIPGNHDPWVKGSYYKSYDWTGNVYILGGDKLSKNKPYLEFEEENTHICIYGQISSDEYQGQNHVDLSYQNIDPSKINILLLHGSIDFDFDKSSYNPISSKKLASMDMDYIGIGHFHNRIDKVAGRNNIYNPGSPEPLGFDEPGKHGFYMGTISIDHSGRKEVEVEFISVNRKEYIELEVNIAECITDNEIVKRIKDRIADAGIKEELYPNLLAGITLTGYISPDFAPDIKYISSFFRDKIFYVKIKDHTAPDYDFDEIKKEIGLKGLFTRKVLNLIDAAEDQAEKELLKKSLYYGIEALEKGQVDISDY